MAKTTNSKWKDWYWNKGGRDKVLLRRRAHLWMSKREFEEMQGAETISE